MQPFRREANRIYNPQIRNLNQQLGQVGATFDPQRESLRQARINAFRDVDTDATGRGMFYSGAPTVGRARYDSESYFPGLQDLAQQEAQMRQTLTGDIADLRIQRGESALNRYDTSRDRLQQRRLSDRQIQSQQRIADQQTRATLQAARL